MKIAYFVHDLSDPAVHRRVRMLKLGSAQVTVVGFTRVADPPEYIDGCEVINLGLTKDGRHLERIGSVASVALWLEHLQKVLVGSHVVLARTWKCSLSPRKRGAAMHLRLR